MADTVVSSGVTSSGLVINNSDTLIVNSGGLTIGTQINSGGQELISSGGAASGSVINNGGIEFAFSGASTTGTIVSSGGTESAVGGTTTGTILNGGTEEVHNGATTTGTVVSSGGWEMIANGTTSGTAVGDGGTSYVDANGIAVGTVINGSGTESVFSGKTISTVISSGGAEYVYSGGTTTGTVISSGGAEYVSSGTATDTVINSGGVEDVSSGGADSGATISSGGILRVHSGGSVSGIHLLAGGTIDLTDITYSAGETGNFDSATDTFTLPDNTTLHLAGDYAGLTFHLTDDGNGGTDITLDAACYLKGTRIATPSGDTPVEALQIGDLVRTHAGQDRPIKWIGRRGYMTRALSPKERQALLPIRIAQGALGNNLPRCDLFVSPEHMLYLNDVLIPAHLLVNGATIVQTDAGPGIEYFHIELDGHDILLAEGAPAESWLDTGNRNMFGNAVDYLALGYPPAAAPAPFAPIVTEGPVLEAVRRRLALPILAAA